MKFLRSVLFLKQSPDKHSLETVLRDCFKVMIRETKLIYLPSKQGKKKNKKKKVEAASSFKLFPVFFKVG